MATRQVGRVASKGTSDLPPRLLNFFARFPPRQYGVYFTGDKIVSLKEKIAIEGDKKTGAPPTATQSIPVSEAAASEDIAPSIEEEEATRTNSKSSRGLEPNPFLPYKNPATGHWRGARISLRRQAELFKLAQRYGGYSSLAFVGTPESIADEMARWLDQEACDGFTIVMPYLPQGLEDVAKRVVPELQRRGLFRSEYV